MCHICDYNGPIHLGCYTYLRNKLRTVARAKKKKQTKTTVLYNNSTPDKLKNIIQFVWRELNKQQSSIVFSVKTNNTDSGIYE